MSNPPSVPPISWPNGRIPKALSPQGCITITTVGVAVTACLAIGQHWLWILLLPIFWITVALGDRARMGPVVRGIDKQLATRQSFPAHLWGSPERAELAVFAGELIAEEAAWPNHYFTPDDPLDVLLFTPFGDGLEDIVIFDALKKRVGRKVRFEPSQTFGQLIDMCLTDSPTESPELER